MDHVKDAEEETGTTKETQDYPRSDPGRQIHRNVLDLLRPLHEHRDCPNRYLHYDEYVAFLLLYFFPPVLDSMRGLQQASEFNVLKRKSSSDDSGSVFDPELHERDIRFIEIYVRDIDAELAAHIERLQPAMK
ncbi:MAG: hypothetical protein GXP25_17145 [Planctomycetes bacterium]|nr:hypothetical protein [Planctomycetota bacterium]